MDAAIEPPITPAAPTATRWQRPARPLLGHFDEAYFQAIFQTSSERILMLSVEGFIRYVSPRVCRMMGYKAEALIGHYCLDFVHPEDRAAIKDFVWKRFSHLKHSDATLEVRLQHADGHWVYVETLPGMFMIDGRLIGVSMALHDVTQRKQAEHALQQRIENEQWVAEINARLARASNAQFDQVLRETLATICTYFELDFCSFIEYSADQEFVRILSFWSNVPIPQISENIQLVRDEVWTNLMLQKQVICVGDVDDLPENAHGMRAIFRLMRAQSLLAVSLSDGDQVIGEMFAITNRYQRHWTEAEIQLLRSISETLTRVMLRKGVETALRRRLDIEQLVAEISRHLGGALPEEINEGIHWTLRRVCETLDVEMGYVFQFSKDGKYSSVTHAYISTEQKDSWKRLQNLPINHAWTEQISRQRYIYFLDVEQLPPEMADIQASMRIDGVRSSLAVPLMLEGQHNGDFVLQSTRTRYTWNEQDIRLIQIIGETMTTALARLNARLAMQQRLEYEHLLGEISSKFVSCPIDQYDQAIADGLDKIGTFMGGELCMLWQYSADQRYSQATHIWSTTPNINAQLQGRIVPINAWWSKHLLTDQFIYSPDVGALPEEASDVREGLLGLGSRSVICVPLMQGNVALGDISLNGVTRVPEWTSENIRMMQLITEVFSSAITRQRAHRALQQRIAFEHLASEISASFAHIPIEQTDAAITSAIEKLGGFIGSDICRVFLIDRQSDLVGVAYEWCASEVHVQYHPSETSDVVWSQVPWREQLERNEVIIIDNVTKSATAHDTVVSAELESDFNQRGLKSLLSVPMMLEGELIGVLGLDNLKVYTHWTDENVALVRLIAGLISSALSRKRAADAIRTERDLLEIRVEERTRQLSKLLDVSSTVNSMLDLKSLLQTILEKLREVVIFDSAAITRLQKYNEVSGDLPIIAHIGNLNAKRLLTPGTYSASEDLHLREMMMTMAPVIIPDTTADTSNAAAFRRRQLRVVGAIPERILCAMYVPLIVQQRVIGMLVIYSIRRYAYSRHSADLAFAFANQVAAAIYKAQNHQQAIEAAALTERSRLARELHDSVSQALFGIVLAARTLQQNVGGPNETQSLTNKSGINPLEYLLSLSEAALSEMRALIFELRPESLRQEGLLSAFRRQAEALAQRHRLSVDTQMTANEPTFDIDVKEAFYRVGLEAIQNIVKHARASHLILRVRQDEAQFVLEVSDNGCGFDVNTRMVGHFGLQTMQERATAAGGTLEILSESGLGTTVRMSVPINAVQPPQLPQPIEQPRDGILA